MPVNRAPRLPMPSPLNTRFVFNEHGQVVTTTKRSKVAIVGASTRLGRVAPLDDPEWEVWGLNAMVRTFTDWQGRFRADRFFEMHPRSAQGEQDMEFFRACPCPLYGLDDWKELEAPHGLAYPLKAVLWHFGFEPGRFGDLFPCTFTYQIALAIKEGFKTIGLFGIDLDYGTPREMTVERTGVAFWAAFAAGCGIEIVTPRGTTLFTHPERYGFSYVQEAAWTREYLARMTADGVGDPTRRAELGDGAMMTRDDITPREWRSFMWTDVGNGLWMRGQRNAESR